MRWRFHCCQNPMFPASIIVCVCVYCAGMRVDTLCGERIELNWIEFCNVLVVFLSSFHFAFFSILFLRSAMRHTSHIDVEHCLVSISVRANDLALHLSSSKNIFCVMLEIHSLQMKNNVNNMQQTFSGNTIRSISVYNWHFPFALFHVVRALCSVRHKKCTHSEHFGTCWLLCVIGFFFFASFCRSSLGVSVSSSSCHSWMHIVFDLMTQKKKTQAT